MAQNNIIWGFLERPPVPVQMGSFSLNSGSIFIEFLFGDPAI